MKNFIKKYYWHLVFWVSFIIYEVTMVKVVTGVYGTSKNYILHYPINIALVYVVALLVLPKTLGKNRRNFPLLIVLLTICMLLYLLASNLADLLLGKISDEVFFGNAGITKIFISGTIYRAIYFMGFGTTLFLFQNRISILERSNELEKESAGKDRHRAQLDLELAAAKNAYLRAQINPHFMLSTLNYIHDSTRLSEPAAAKAVIYLSTLLRYALASERGPEKIPLYMEIEQVENLFNITKIRKAQTFVNFNYEKNTTDTEIIPFVLLSLAENMLKHGNISVATDPGEISISIVNNFLIIKTSNLISAGINDTGFHTGLFSIKERLAHIYGSRSSISHGRENSHFKTKVTIPIAQAHDI